jgi:hypothetical protein
LNQNLKEPQAWMSFKKFKSDKVNVRVNGQGRVLWHLPLALQRFRTICRKVRLFVGT